MTYRTTHYALELMKTGIDFILQAKARSSMTTHDGFIAMMCFCIKEVKPGLWLPLNRDYNVLGLLRGGWSDHRSQLYDQMLIKAEDINFDILWNESPFPSKDYYIFSDLVFPRIFYKKNKDTCKIANRYIQVIYSAFFKDSKITFDEAWNYKSHLDDYKVNIKRIEKKQLKD